MRCDHCRAATAQVMAIEHPENDAALMFGDRTAIVALCTSCLVASLANGPWDDVEPIAARAPEPSATQILRDAIAA